MGKFLTKFTDHTAYENAESNLILPNVSLCVQEGGIYYKPWVETRIVTKLNVTDTSNGTLILNDYRLSAFSAIEIDGVEQPSVISAYTFDTTGEHEIKYTLKNKSIIPPSAFKYIDFTDVQIPSTVNTIGQAAFSMCESLTSVTIPDSVTRIELEAFFECTNLSTVKMTNNLTFNGGNIFYKDNKLPVYNNIRYADNLLITPTNKNLTSYTIKEGTKYFDIAAFESCKNITSVGVVGSGASIEIPNEITELPNAIFRHCSGLTSATLHSNITKIGIYSFTNCSGLTGITIESIEPPYMQYDRRYDTTYGEYYNDYSSVFKNTNDCPIYVPSGSVNAYKAADGWKTYKSRIQAIP